MKRYLKNIVKNNKIIYSIYYFIFSLFLRFIGIFIKTQENLALFVCYGGKRYDDSTKVLYEYVKSDEKYKKLKEVWAFVEPNKFDMIQKDEKVKIDTFKYYITALKAKYWITNSSVSRGLDFKKKETKYIVFQHGTLGIKKLGKDLEKNNKSFHRSKAEPIDMFIIQGKKEKEKLIEAFGLKEEQIKMLGLPRNDELTNVTEKRIQECKEKLGIPKGKKVVLYAPTYREFKHDSLFNSVLNNPFDFKELKQELSKEYVFVVTAHYEVAKMLDIPDNDDFVINAFSYPYINDLLIVADILISDYSSVVFDYTILERPILCFAYDYDIYMEERGTYIDLNKLFYDGVIKTQEDLIKIIKNMDYQAECEHSRKIKQEYIGKYGNTVQNISKIIFD